MKRLAVFFVALFCAAAFAQDLPKIAVYVTGNVPDDEKKTLGTKMLATLINSGRYKGIERSNSFLAEIEKEQVKQRSGSIDDSQISELGRQFGVKFVCIADITPAFGEYQVSARIVNVETAEVAFIGESFSPLKTAADLVAVSNQVVKNMFGGGEPAETPPRQTFTVTVAVNPAEGGSVTRSADKDVYDAWETLTLTAVPGSGYTFAGWSGSSSSSNPVLAGQINGDLELTANFQAIPPLRYTLTTAVFPQGGGSIIRSPDKEAYEPGETVTVTATSAANHRFTGWTGAMTGRKNFVTVTMDGDRTLTANFYQKSTLPPGPGAEARPESGGGAQKLLGVGGGLLYAGDFAGGLQWDDGGVLGMPCHSFGAFLFLDATYATVSIGYSDGSGKWETPNNVNPDDLPEMGRTALNLGVSVKYPIAGSIANKAITLYPTAGIDYDMALDGYLSWHDRGPYAFDGTENINKDSYTADALSAVWIKFGAGLDLYLTENAFIRGELLYGVRMSNQFETEKAEAFGAEARLGSGVTIKAGAGFKL